MSLLEEGKTVWRKTRTGRANLLKDAAEYFGALRQCLLNARRSVFIVGWDIHSQTRLVGPDGCATDDLPEKLGAFLEALVDRRPTLQIYILIWNSPILYAGEREWFPGSKIGRAGQTGLRFRLDDCLPIGSAQHQKFVVVDDAVAFSGGCDLTIRRWDTHEHLPTCVHRVDPHDVPYPPFHDVQMIVDSEAARAFAELARYRWSCATRQDAIPVEPTGDPWPRDLVPDFNNAIIGIARTDPMSSVEEVAQLFETCIAAAEDSIYIENQFMSSVAIAQCLTQRMRQRPNLEVLLIAPKTHVSWFEARSMQNGRIDFMKVFDEAGLRDRVRLLHPQIQSDGTTALVMVHSKVMIVDDRILRVGSANLNNRSMGADTECDLVIEAQTQQERNKITELRDALIGHFCGASAETAASELAKHRSLLRLADSLSHNGHSLQAVDDGEADPNEMAGFVKPLADPSRPLGLEQAAKVSFPTLMKILAVIAAIGILGLIWRVTPLYEYTELETISQMARSIQDDRSAPLLIVLAFVLGGFVLFPVLVLISATAAALGPWLGLGTAAVGVLTSASIIYAVGRWVGLRPLQDLLGHRFERARKQIVGNGVIAVALIRMVPVAPFSIVNLAAGASGILFSDYLVGTILGMAPGLIAISVFGAQIADLVTEPSWRNIGIAGLGLAVWLLFSISAQFVVAWLSRRA